MRPWVGAAPFVAGAASLVAESAEALHSEWVVGERGRLIEELTEATIVASGRHLQSRANRSLLAAWDLPARAFEVEDGAIKRREFHRRLSMVGESPNSADFAHSPQGYAAAATNRGDE